ncbi:DUF1737 domain-containing protein [Tautonia plasticadhaerens]|uniref:DUF1737 domain-containing protein n=1 Tax=Tautonia plasticadhaerens TaxID=2527974 RepID=A0A518HA54_9BACT|nr:DUF1737 domain-containing protein [Tautonia plasticadhaerens]QDV37732.1 hypothetical protein ElP_56770 [Tautonia plasticadhaerens]
MHYHICEAKSAKGLREEVSRLLAKGWRPLGGVATVNSSNSGNWWYFQAMMLLGDDAGTSYDQDEAFALSDLELA